jgi:circadian clock protein KaiC
VKKRETDFEKSLREFTITGGGIKVGEPLTDLRGILTGTPDMAGGRREDGVDPVALTP